MRKKYYISLLFFCFFFNLDIFSEDIYFIRKDVNDAKPMIIDKKFVKPNQLETDGIDFVITPNFEGDNYSIIYNNESYVYNLPIKKKKYPNDFTNNPLEGIRSKDLIFYFEYYQPKNNFKNIMKNADFYLFDSINLPKNQKIKINDVWTEYTNLVSDLDKGKRIMHDFIGAIEGKIDGTFLGVVDKYQFKGIVENDQTRYALIEADMTLVVIYFVFGCIESRAYINKGKATIAYDYQQKKIKEIFYKGFYNCYARGHMLVPLEWVDNKYFNDEDINKLRDFIKKAQKKMKISDSVDGDYAWGDVSTILTFVSNASFNSAVIKARKATRPILAVYSKLSSDETLKVSDNILKSKVFPIKHDDLINYMIYYLYNR